MAATANQSNSSMQMTLQKKDAELRFARMELGKMQAECALIVRNDYRATSPTPRARKTNDSFTSPELRPASTARSKASTKSSIQVPPQQIDEMLKVRNALKMSITRGKEVVRQAERFEKEVKIKEDRFQSLKADLDQAKEDTLWDLRKTTTGVGQNADDVRIVVDKITAALKTRTVVQRQLTDQNKYLTKKVAEVEALGTVEEDNFVTQAMRRTKKLQLEEQRDEFLMYERLLQKKDKLADKKEETNRQAPNRVTHLLSENRTKATTRVAKQLDAKFVNAHSIKARAMVLARQALKMQMAFDAVDSWFERQAADIRRTIGDESLSDVRRFDEAALAVKEMADVVEEKLAALEKVDAKIESMERKVSFVEHAITVSHRGATDAEQNGVMDLEAIAHHFQAFEEKAAEIMDREYAKQESRRNRKSQSAGRQSGGAEGSPEVQEEEHDAEQVQLEPVVTKYTAEQDARDSELERQQQERERQEEEEEERRKQEEQQQQQHVDPQPEPQPEAEPEPEQSNETGENTEAPAEQGSEQQSAPEATSEPVAENSAEAAAVEESPEAADGEAPAN